MVIMQAPAPSEGGGIAGEHRRRVPPRRGRDRRCPGDQRARNKLKPLLAPGEGGGGAEVHLLVCGCQRAGCGAVFDGAPGSSVCPACAAGPPGAGAAWTHAPDPDGGTRCGKGSEGRDVLARAGEATCPDCRAAIDPDGTQFSAPAPRQPDVLPPEPVPAETRRDSLLPVVQSVSEPPEREAGRLAFGGLIEGRADPGGQLPLLPAPEGPRVPLLPT